MARLSGQVWLFGPAVDLAVFGGSALFSAALVLLAPHLGGLGDTPVWAWALLVLGIDVSHVWSTLFRTYLDIDELRRRPALYAGVPIIAYAIGFTAHQLSPLSFWRLFAYAALFHFVRQQYGWVALYGRKEQAGPLDRRLDAAAVYAATLGPVLFWHARLPRPFWWFVPGDFVPLPSWVGTAALAAEAVVLGAWWARQGFRLATGRTVQLGKAALVGATALTWYWGIVAAQDDFTFTAMNVVLHGAPYFALLYRYARGRYAEGGFGRLGVVLRLGVPGFFAVLLALAYAEELAWDRLVWHDHEVLFGAGVATLTDAALSVVVPLLALPQATHYLLDAFIWRPSQDPALLARLGWARGSRAPPAPRPV